MRNRRHRPAEQAARAALALAALLPGTALAADGATLQWWPMSMQLLGGLALFLYGMEQMASALKSVAGEGLKILLARLTGNRVWSPVPPSPPSSSPPR